MSTYKSSGAIPPRQAGSRPLKRIATMAGAYGQRNYTVHDIRALKGQRTLVETLAFTPEEAAAAEEAGSRGAAERCGGIPRRELDTLLG